MNAWIVVLLVVIVAVAVTAGVLLRNRRQQRPPAIGLPDLGSLTEEDRSDEAVKRDDRPSWTSDGAAGRSANQARPPRR